MRYFALDAMRCFAHYLSGTPLLFLMRRGMAHTKGIGHFACLVFRHSALPLWGDDAYDQSMIMENRIKNRIEKVFCYATLLLVFLLMAACQSRVATENGAYTNVTAKKLHAMLRNKDFIFVNVHIPYGGNIAGTDLSTPYNEITAPDNLAKLPADKNAKIVLYCRSGRMSAMAAEALVNLGYTNVWNLEGGMVAWENAGYPLEP